MPKYDWKLRPAEELDPDADALLRQVREAFHPSLGSLTIRLLFRPRPTSSRGRLEFGTVTLATERERVIGGPHAWIIVAWEWWQQATPPQREALLDHELSHLVRDGDTGELCLQDHDLQEFVVVWLRRGNWTSNLAWAAERLQLELTGLGGEEGDG